MPPVKTMRSRREQYSAATRAAILDAATRRFAERGYAGTALEDVAADIQGTRGAVYHHFPNKKALFEAVFEDLELATVQEVAKAAAGETDPWLAAQIALDAYLERCCDPVYGRVVWQEGPIALGWSGWKECEERFCYGLTERLVRGLIEGGHVEPMPVETAARVTFAILGAAGQALADAAEADKPRMKAEYAAVTRRLLVGRGPANP